MSCFEQIIINPDRARILLLKRYQPPQLSIEVVYIFRATAQLAMSFKPFNKQIDTALLDFRVMLSV